MNTLAPNLLVFWREETRLHWDVAHLLVGIGILASVCQTGMAQEPLPLPNDSQSQAVEDEQMPQICRPIPVDPTGMELTVDIQPRGKDSQVVPEEDLPEDCAQYVFSDVPMWDDFSLTSGGHAPGYNWAAARFCHHPLYFQEYCLERCGVDHGCFQPILSGMHFFGNVALLPWKMWQRCPCDCECTPICDCAN